MSQFKEQIHSLHRAIKAGDKKKALEIHNDIQRDNKGFKMSEKTERAIDERARKARKETKEPKHE